MEVRNLAKELVACLAPGMQEAKFVKEVQAQLISMLRAAKNEEFIWLVGALVGGFTSGLQPPGTRVQLRNFGPIAYLVCPTEIVAAEDEPWSGRIASINKNQNDLTPFLKIDGGYLVKFLLSLYTIPSANPSPASIFCLGDLSFSIGDYANATKQYLHGLSMQSGHFTDMVAILDPYLGNKGWNQRLGQCLQITGRFLGAAVVMQMVKDSVDGVVMVDFQSACVALDAVVEGLVGDDPEEVEGLLVYLYDMTLLEYVTYLLKRKSKTESMKVAVRLIGRRELGYGVDDFVKQQYILKLKQRFLKDLAEK
ncbi:Integrator complex subunit 8, partial [Rhizoclosmatium hyalinum]